MTKEQAVIFFPFSLDDDLDDLWDFRFFEVKQYFFTHAPIRKVWESRLKRITKAREAYLILTDQPQEVFESLSQQDRIKFSDEIITSFHEFHDRRNKYKSDVFQASTVGELVGAVEKWLAIEEEFNAHWAYEGALKDEIKAIRIQAPDPMELLNELKKMVTFHKMEKIAEMHKNFDILPEIVRKEVKRLTLLAND